MPDNFEIGMIFSDLHSWIQYYSKNPISDSTLDNLHESLTRFVWYSKQPEHVQCALINLILMNGLKEIKKIPDLIESLNECNYKKAVLILMNSRIYLKNRERVKDICVTIMNN